MQKIGDFFFRSRFSKWLWNTSVTHSWRVIRLAGMTLIAVILTARSIRLFMRVTPKHVIISVAVAAAAVRWGPGHALAGAFLLWIGRTAFLLAQQPEVNLGHRAGFPGFEGVHCENTVEGLEDLIRRDNLGQLKLGQLAYVEFDVHETADGHLVVLHDLQSVLRASAPHPINAEAMAALWASTPDLDAAQVKDVRCEDLRRLCVAGREGVHVPTLDAFLRCCSSMGLRRSVAVEVKCIHSDAARSDFVRLLRGYKEGHCSKLEEQGLSPSYCPFGSLAAISFPFLWAPSFGEFGSTTWWLWGQRFKSAGIPVRSCVVHHLDLLTGA